MRLATYLVAAVAAALLGLVFSSQKDKAPDLADTVSSEVGPFAPATDPVCIEQLDAVGNVIATYEVSRFVARHGPEKMIDAHPGMEPELVTGPGGLVAFETIDGARVFLYPPWRLE